VSNARARLPFLWLILVLSLASCGKHNTANEDAGLQKKLTGTWILEHTPILTNFESKVTIDSDGIYTAHCKCINTSNLVRFDIEGFYKVKNGWLIDTMTENGALINKTLLPHMSTNQIVKLTEAELVVNLGTTNEPLNAVFHKEGK